jgi:hypothetical protein
LKRQLALNQSKHDAIATHDGFAIEQELFRRGGLRIFNTTGEVIEAKTLRASRAMLGAVGEVLEIPRP